MKIYREAENERDFQREISPDISRRSASRARRDFGHLVFRRCIDHSYETLRVASVSGLCNASGLFEVRTEGFVMLWGCFGDLDAWFMGFPLVYKGVSKSFPMGGFLCSFGVGDENLMMRLKMFQQKSCEVFVTIFSI